MDSPDSSGGRYRANPNYLRNPKVCVGCFEFYLSKILRQHLKQGEKKILRFFSAEPIFAERIETKVFFIFAFFLRNPFLRRAQSQKLIFFLRSFFLRQNNTLDRELIISANS